MQANYSVFGLVGTVPDTVRWGYGFRLRSKAVVSVKVTDVPRTAELWQRAKSD